MASCRTRWNWCGSPPSCGADAVKLQIFRAVNLVHVPSDLAEYQQAKPAIPTRSIF